MPSTDKTSLGFNLWAGDDKPKRADFNNDNNLANDKFSQLSKDKANKSETYTKEEIDEGWVAQKGLLADFDVFNPDGIYWFSGTTANVPPGISDGIVMIRNQEGFSVGLITFQSVLNGLRGTTSVMAARTWYSGVGWTSWSIFEP